MADDVPRNVERRIESGANVRGLDIKSIELEEENTDGSVFRVVIYDEDAEEGENPAFFVLYPNSGDMTMFGDRLERKMSAVRKKLLGVTDETDEKLEETRQQLEESGHPNAQGEDVEYGPGAIPNVGGATGGYEDEYMSIRSISDAELPELPDHARQDPAENESNGRMNEQDMTTDTTTQSTQSTAVGQTVEQSFPDDFWGDIADAAMDARELEEKGHERAANALLEDIQDEIHEYLGDE